MKFTTPCFIRKNTPELRYRLEDVGYKHNGYPFLISHGNNIYVYSNLTGDERFDNPHYVTGDALDLVDYYKFIDCGTNEALFLALAALREDTDEGQWFVFTELFLTDCHVFHSGDIIHYDEVEKMFTAFEQPMHVRKATPAELIEYFTKNNE